MMGNVRPRPPVIPQIRLIDCLLLPAAVLLVVVEEVFWRGARFLLRAMAQWPPLRRLHARLGRLPPWLALPLFLVPEATSRAGFFISAWLVWEGEARAAAMLYAGTKLIAGLVALWIYTGCEPALLRVRWFRTGHDWVTRLRRVGLEWLRRRPRQPGRVALRFAHLRRSLAARLPWRR